MKKTRNARRKYNRRRQKRRTMVNKMHEINNMHDIGGGRLVKLLTAIAVADAATDAAPPAATTGRQRLLVPGPVPAPTPTPFDERSNTGNAYERNNFANTFAKKAKYWGAAVAAAAGAEVAERAAQSLLRVPVDDVRNMHLVRPVKNPQNWYA